MEKNIGEIVSIIGPVVDIRFSEDNLPELLNAIEIDNHGKRLVVEVAQHIGDDTVRCVSMSEKDEINRRSTGVE